MKPSAAVLLLLLATTAFAAKQDSGPQPTDLTPQFRAEGFAIDRLQAFEIGGVVVIRGRALDAAVAEDAGRFAQSLGYTRIANLVKVVAPPDDAVIERLAERELSRHRSLDGCTFYIDSDNGVVRLAGHVRHQLQKDYAIELLRNIDGVREVHADLQRR
ncbi:MAG TPA: BON domain-containing protein [Thermoanaerobaculia bacterium]|jgi:osmotically-inducible protein OsmY|nr:BON domain-containing protein [Thermoanaerobaculia bacterium]